MPCGTRGSTSATSCCRSGSTAVEEPDEIAGCLGYVAALSPAFVVAGGSTRRGAIAVEASDPAVRFVVDVGESVIVRAGEAPGGALHLTGPAVELVEGLSFRGPLPCQVADEHRWLLEGLAEVFEHES